jgi:hypothetical protein
VDRTGDELFSGAGLTLYQYGGGRRRELEARELTAFET